MDPNFKNKELKKEYENLHKNNLLTLNKCGNCNIFKCIYCTKFSVNCSSCLLWRCKTCTAFNKSKDILLNSVDGICACYVSNFLVDYFSVSDLSNDMFNMNIGDEVRGKNALYIYERSNKKNVILMKKKDEKNIQ